MVEENFEIWHSEMLHIGLILLFIDNNYYFTMVEENFEIWHIEMLQIGLIYLLLLTIIKSPWLKKMLKFDSLERSRLDFSLHLEKNLEMSRNSFVVKIGDPT